MKWRIVLSLMMVSAIPFADAKVKKSKLAIPTSTRFKNCPSIHFSGKASKEDGTQETVNMNWNPATGTYIIHGNPLAAALNRPGVGVTSLQNQNPEFRIQVKDQASQYIDRGENSCQEWFQEFAKCDERGDLYYNQVYSDCNGENYSHLYKISTRTINGQQAIEISEKTLNDDHPVATHRILQDGEIDLASSNRGAGNRRPAGQ